MYIYTGRTALIISIYKVHNLVSQFSPAIFRGGGDVCFSPDILGVFSPSSQPSKGKRRREEDGSDGELLEMSYEHLLSLLVKEQALRRRIRSGAAAKVRPCPPPPPPPSLSIFVRCLDLHMF